MKNEILNRYSEWRITDAIVRLESFRSSIGWGELNDDLSVAIDCLEHLVETIRTNDKEDAEEECRNEETPHWIVFDHGFAGLYYQCSKCEDGYWPTDDKRMTEECPHCHSIMDLDKTEYID